MSDTEQGKVAPNRRRRKPKQPNSHEFHEVFDRAIALSVTEKVRLIRALAGLQGLVVNNPKPSQVQSEPAQTKAQKRVKESLPVSDNPLKGTTLQQNLLAAQAAVREKKASLGVDKLSPDDETLGALKAAMTAYQVEHRERKPYEEVNDTSKPVTERQRLKRQRKASKSPIRTDAAASATEPATLGTIGTKRSSRIANMAGKVAGYVSGNATPKPKVSGATPRQESNEGDADMQHL
jgi:hypothetical protein